MVNIVLHVDAESPIALLLIGGLLDKFLSSANDAEISISGVVNITEDDKTLASKMIINGTVIV